MEPVWRKVGEMKTAAKVAAVFGTGGLALGVAIGVTSLTSSPAPRQEVRLVTPADASLSTPTTVAVTTTVPATTTVATTVPATTVAPTTVATVPPTTAPATTVPVATTTAPSLVYSSPTTLLCSTTVVEHGAAGGIPCPGPAPGGVRAMPANTAPTTLPPPAYNP